MMGAPISMSAGTGMSAWTGMIEAPTLSAALQSAEEWVDLGRRTASRGIDAPSTVGGMCALAVALVSTLRTLTHVLHHILLYRNE